MFHCVYTICELHRGVVSHVLQNRAPLNHTLVEVSTTDKSSCLWCNVQDPKEIEMVVSCETCTTHDRTAQCLVVTESAHTPQAVY
jgi:hypothetical protein